MSEEKKYDVDVDAEVTVSEITDEPTPPEPEPGDWVVAAPGSTGGQVTKITNPPGVGFMSPDSAPARNAVDVAVTGGGDTAFMFGAPKGDHAPRLIQRCSAVDVAAGNAVTWAKHAVYGVATLEITDFSAAPSRYAASGISFRWAGENTLRRATIGTPEAGFPLPISFYDSGEGFGSIDIDQVVLWSSSNTGIWASINTGKKVQSHFRIGAHVEAHASGGELLFAAELWDPASTLTVSRRATINGNPASAESITGVPASAIAWVE